MRPRIGGCPRRPPAPLAGVPPLVSGDMPVTVPTTTSLSGAVRGHFVHQERPREFASLMRHWLRGRVVAPPRLEFRRSPLMGGARHCDFRWQLRDPAERAGDAPPHGE